jgi:hypothetical protein
MSRDRLDYPLDRPARHRRSRVRLWLIVFVAALFPLAALVMLGLGIYRVHQAAHAADDFNVRYRQVQRGMNRSQVQAIMGDGGAAQREPIAGKNFTMWDGEPLSEGEREAITGALIFKPTPAYTGVFFEFTFDQDGKVVGKHRYD